jgi:diaminopimelate decarboxylase
MSSHFLHRPRPAEVLVQSGRARLIRERESLADLLRHQLDPQ